MAITTDDFNKIWASTSPLTPYEFSESNYKEGWNFIGGTPPSRQMWDFLQKQNDEKLKYLLDNFDDYAKKTDLDDYLPLSGGTMTGDITFSNNVTSFRRTNYSSYMQFYGGSAWDNGAHLILNGKDRNNNEGGFFIIAANAGSGAKYLIGNPNGTLTWDGQPLLPVGVVQAFAGATIPTGWLLCNGSAVSRTTYANLFACIGTTYGSGDGSTTFNVPNLIDKFVEGSATAGTEKSAGLPNITGNVSVARSFEMHGSGAFESTGNGSVYTTGGGVMTTTTYAELDASRSSSIYGNSDTVQPPALTMKYIIKY